MENDEKILEGSARESSDELNAETKRQTPRDFRKFATSFTNTRVKTGNWHVFPIDNRLKSAKMAIAGARALSSPSPADAREPKRSSARRMHEQS